MRTMYMPCTYMPFSNMSDFRVFLFRSGLYISDKNNPGWAKTKLGISLSVSTVSFHQDVFTRASFKSHETLLGREEKENVVGWLFSALY